MSNHVIEFQSIWKKFTRGERHDSLRDLIPSIIHKLLSASNPPYELKAREFWAVKDVSFQVDSGEALGIIGPNGSGKSTILKLLSRILKPDKGELRIRGRLGTLIELGAGFHPDLTGRENIYLNGTILGMTRQEIKSKFDEIVEFSQLKDFLDTPVKRYSSGMYARLGFSVAAHVDPEVLIVDEVLSVGDYHFQQRCFDKMREFIKHGTSIVFVSHNMTAISTLCDKALLIKQGQPIFCGNTSTAVQKYHALFETEVSNENIEVLDAKLTVASGVERDVLEPGEKVLFEVTFRARAELVSAHAAILIHTADGQLVFDTATSRLLDRNRALTLRKGESATVGFTLDMNLCAGVFLLGFTITSEHDTTGQFIYFNRSLKRIVMTGEHKSSGIVFLNPKAEVVLG